MIWDMCPSRRAGRWQGFRTGKAADTPVPVNKRVPHTGPSERCSMNQESGNGQEPIVEIRTPTTPVPSPRGPSEAQYLDIQLLLESGKAWGDDQKQPCGWGRLTKEGWGQSPQAVTSASHFNLAQAPVLWPLLGCLRFRTWVQRTERERFILQKKNKAEINLFGTPFRKNLWRGWFLL